MVFKSVKEVIESTDLNAVFSFVSRGLWYTPLTEDEYDGAKSKPEALGVASFSKTIQVPPEIYRKKDQLEQYKSNLYFYLAKQLLDEIFKAKTTPESGIVSIPTVAGTNDVEANPLKAYDLIKRASYVNGGIYFNAAHAATVDFSTVAGGKVFPRWFNADSSEVLAFGIVDGSFNLWLDESEEEQFILKDNKHYITATVFAQGLPTLAPSLVKKA